MTKVLITRDEGNTSDVISTSDPRVVIWERGITKNDVSITHGNTYDFIGEARLVQEGRNFAFLEIEPEKFKKIFGWIPCSGTANYYRLRKLRKKKSPTKKLQEAIKGVFEELFDRAETLYQARLQHEPE